MTDELRAVIGCCADCRYLWSRGYINDDDEECFIFSCLNTNEKIEERTFMCNCFQDRNSTKLIQDETVFG